MVWHIWIGVIHDEEQVVVLVVQKGAVAGVNQPADGEDALIVPENVNNISVTGANPVKNSTTWGSKAHAVNCAELPLGQGLESIVGLDGFHTSVAAIEELGD